MLYKFRFDPFSKLCLFSSSLYFGGAIGGFWAFGDFPRHANDFAILVGPEVDDDPDEVVDCRIGALVQEYGAEDAERVKDKPRGDASVKGGVGNEKWERVFPAYADYTHQQINGLKGGDWFDSGVKRPGEKRAC